MEGRLTEEQITKAILNWLEKNNWEIFCFDFPQSGTGMALHPNEKIRTTKNKGAIIPDIVAFKTGTAVFFENKDRFVVSDFNKIQDLKTGKDYEVSIEKLLKSTGCSEICYGVGLPYNETYISRSLANNEKIDFALFVTLDRTIAVKYDPKSIFMR